MTCRFDKRTDDLHTSQMGEYFRPQYLLCLSKLKNLRDRFSYEVNVRNSQFGLVY